MAGRSSYIIAHPNNEDSITELKSGKVPTWACWHRHTHTGEWVRSGWSYKATKAEAEKASKSSYRNLGGCIVTRVLPASL